MTDTNRRAFFRSIAMVVPAVLAYARTAGATDRPITIHNSYTVGDIASVEQIKAAVRRAERRKNPNSID